MNINRIKVFLLLALGLINICTKAQNLMRNVQPTEINIKDAIQQRLVELEIRGAYGFDRTEEIIDMDGVHYGKCMSITLQSGVDSMLFLRLDCGTQLIPDDSAVQTMIVTKTAVFPLQPNYPLVTRFYAMCGQIHDAPPTMVTKFTIGELADTGLVKLAKYLDANYIQNVIGQHAVWAYTDQADITELQSYGAESLSLARTKDILDAVGLETRLNAKAPAKPVIVEDSGLITLNRFYVFAGAGLILVLLTTTIVLIYRSRKKVDQVA
jgi:hypothetical protein